MLSQETVNLNSVTVLQSKIKKHLKILKLSYGEDFCMLPASACIGNKDSIEVLNDEISVICNNGKAKILPYYSSIKTIERNGLKIELLFKEITEEDEFDSYKRLASLHYREGRAFGRVSRIIARNFNPLYPSVVGFIEIGTALYMNKARTRILDSHFSCENIEWDRWNVNTHKSKINLIARITRCVVIPEFRNLGLGQALVNSAIEFAKDHWQVSNMKPYFLEISADMLKFVPFAEKSGMLYIGETEGNLKRISADMGYLLRNLKRIKNSEIVNRGSSGIVDQQISRMHRTIKIMEKKELKLEEVVDKLKNLSKEKVLRDFDLFSEIISLPKPTYMIGLNLPSQQFLRQRINDLGIKKNNEIKPIRINPIKESITLSGIYATYKTSVKRTIKTNAIQQAFGISPSEIISSVIENMSVTIAPGEVVLATGPSGSGKTTLLKILSSFGKCKDSFVTQGELQFPNNYRPSYLKNIRSHKALIELFENMDVNTSLFLMGMVGLSDAFIFLKRFKELSEGQKYRYMLAQMISNGSNVWLIDEFCSNLDAITAKAVSSGLQKIARSLGATVIVASSQYENFITALKPDKVIRMTSSGEIKLVKGSEFIDSLEIVDKNMYVPIFKIKEKFKDSIISGAKRTTIIKGRKNISKDQIVLELGNQKIIANVKNVTSKLVSNLSLSDAINYGTSSTKELTEELSQTYKKLSNSNVITILEFQIASNIGIYKNNNFLKENESRGV